MQRVFKVRTEELKVRAPELRVGDRVLLSGSVYTARDAAHKKLFELLDTGARLPFEISGCVIYYAGPTPGRDGMPVGSCGPTTSSRMDMFSPRLLKLGMCAMIGKGEVSTEVSNALAENRAVYLCAVGGAGALIARHIKNASETAFPELGCESVKRLEIEAMPLTVGVDSYGNSVFERNGDF